MSNVNVQLMLGKKGQGKQSPCEEFAVFQDLLKKLRRMDDNIIHTLNDEIPIVTHIGVAPAKPEDRCSALFGQLNTAYNTRRKTITECIDYQLGKVKTLKQQHEANPDDVTINKQLKSNQSLLRLFQQELSVEEVVVERTQKAFNERCRLASGSFSNYYL